jgi:UDP-glucose 4-epimerase
VDPKSDYFRTLSQIEHFTGDFADEAAVREFIQPCRSIVMLVSHLLPASTSEEIQNVISWYGPAVLKTLELCCEFQVQQIVFVSSGGTIYGENPDCRPIDESHPPNPHCSYGSFCAFLEQSLLTFHNQSQLPYTILRLGNPYGLLKRPEKNQGIIDHYIRAARLGRPFTIFGNGGETRDYIWIDDISKVIARVLNDARNEIFNVGTGIGHTSREVITLVNNEFNLGEVPLIFRPRRRGDVYCSVLDMTKYEKAFGFRCTTSLKEGLEKYAALDTEICHA